MSDQHIQIELGGFTDSYNPDVKDSENTRSKKYTIQRLVKKYSEEQYNYEISANKSIMEPYMGICKILCSSGYIFGTSPPTKEAVESLKQSLEHVNAMYLEQLAKQYEKRVAEHKKLMELVREL